MLNNETGLGFLSGGYPGGFDRSAYNHFNMRPVNKKNDRIRVGLLVPFSGSDAIWGPSCQYSAVLAAAHLNASGGILGREVELFAADAGGSPSAVVDRVHDLIDNHGVNALVGVHLSNVRDAISQSIGLSKPYIFAPQYEGGKSSGGVISIGETPMQQYRGAVHWMINEQGAKKWYLLGNDYVWPRKTHRILKTLIEEAGGTVVQDEYLPFDKSNHVTTLENIRTSQADIVFESLVGSDSVVFNQAFGEEGLSDSVIRLSGAIEENTLMGISPEFSNNLYCVSGYFHSLDTEENSAFLDEYRRAFGETAPIQGAISQSCYESMFALAALAKQAGTFRIDELLSCGQDFSYRAARGQVHVNSTGSNMSSYLMKSNGLDYELVQTFSTQ